MSFQTSGLSHTSSVAAITNGTQSLLWLPRKGVYAITPTDLTGAALIESARLVLSGGAVMLQYRGKPPIPSDAKALNVLCAKFHVPLLINDDLTLAKALNCGVHLGENDASVSEARRFLGPDAIIGASCYDSLVLAQRAMENGASYIAFGSFFPSKTKAVPRRADLELIAKAAVLAAPCVAIGGIELSNARPIIAAGVDYIAVVNGIFAQPDIQAATQALSQLFRDPS
jgi:thiamine-phosphate pyrophosphorylase